MVRVRCSVEPQCGLLDQGTRPGRPVEAVEVEDLVTRHVRAGRDVEAPLVQRQLVAGHHAAVERRVARQREDLAHVHRQVDRRRLCRVARPVDHTRSVRVEPADGRERHRVRLALGEADDRVAVEELDAWHAVGVVRDRGERDGTDWEHDRRCRRHGWANATALRMACRPIPWRCRRDVAQYDSRRRRLSPTVHPTNAVVRSAHST